MAGRDPHREENEMDDGAKHNAVDGYAKEGGLYQDPAGRERRGAEGGGSTIDVTDETDFFVE